jgi:GAF domain-containing protein
MENELMVHTGTKAEQYEQLIPQIAALIEHETELIANLANISAALKTQFNFLWVGFYLTREEELVLGPFQGPIACTRIQKGRGVCGTSWEKREAIIVPDVNQFPGHIACSSFSRSEIVIPIIRFGEVLGILDIDSEHLNHFDETDKKYLEEIAAKICM